MKEKILEILYETIEHLEGEHSFEGIAQKIADGLGSSGDISECGKGERWISKMDMLPDNDEYVLIYPPYLSDIFENEPRHVAKYRKGEFVYYLGGSVHSITWKNVQYWKRITQPVSE